jgi:oxygen-dependent protoporphyrinogen oxidase
MTIDVAVIGAGVSGLTTAHELARRGHRVAVLERQVRAGGNAMSERIGGFLMEHGPSSVNAASPAAALSRRLGLDGARCDLSAQVRYRYLMGGGRLHRISTHPLGFLLSGYLPPRARLRLLAEVFVPPGCPETEETVADFWARRFGPEFTERVIDPLVGGLFAGRASELSMPAVFPALMAMEARYGSISRGVLKRWRAGGRMPGRRLYSWREGMGTLPAALVRNLGPALRTGVAVRRIRGQPGGFRIEMGEAGALDARSVVIATQPHVAAALLDGLDASAMEAAAAIPAPPLAVVFLGYRREQVDHPLDGLGYLTPAREDRALTGALFCSTMFPDRAPEGHVALAGYIGGARAPEAARAHASDLIAEARSEFRDQLGAKGSPAVARVRQWPRGLPQYGLGHGRLVAALDGAHARRPGLFMTGNYFEGPAVGTCVARGLQSAARVHDFLSQRGTMLLRDEAARAESAIG